MRKIPITLAAFGLAAYAGFALADVIVVDQFRYSAHIELAASFRRT